LIGGIARNRKSSMINVQVALRRGLFHWTETAIKKIIRNSWVKGQLLLLTWLGTVLDWRPLGLGQSLREWLISYWLWVRNKQGQLVKLAPNRAQAEYAAHCTRRNIVLKARQVGITTYVAARFFVNTITRPGTVTVQVAHNQESAEEIFRIVHRFLENLPPRLRTGALVTSRANVRQLVFPVLDSEYRVETAADPHAGRGLTIHNLHCSEVASWPRDAETTLASLRAAVAPEGEIVLENKFRDGLSKIIDGVVQCLNASAWAKAR
jgi:hypothetical protein